MGGKKQSWWERNVVGEVSFWLVIIFMILFFVALFGYTESQSSLLACEANEEVHLVSGYRIHSLGVCDKGDVGFKCHTDYDRLLEIASDFKDHQLVSQQPAEEKETKCSVCIDYCMGAETEKGFIVCIADCYFYQGCKQQPAKRECVEWEEREVEFLVSDIGYVHDCEEKLGTGWKPYVDFFRDGYTVSHSRCSVRDPSWCETACVKEKFCSCWSDEPCNN